MAPRARELHRGKARDLKVKSIFNFFFEIACDLPSVGRVVYGRIIIHFYVPPGTYESLRS